MGTMTVEIDSSDLGVLLNIAVRARAVGLIQNDAPANLAIERGERALRGAGSAGSPNPPEKVT